MTDLLIRPDTTPSDTDNDTVHIVCGIVTEADRTVPMYAICGADVTFESFMGEGDVNCEECINQWPKHLIKCMKRPQPAPCLLQSK